MRYTLFASLFALLLASTTVVQVSAAPTSTAGFDQVSSADIANPEPADIDLANNLFTSAPACSITRPIGSTQTPYYRASTRHDELIRAPPQH